MALLLAIWSGGFSLVATTIFVIIYLTGATLIGRDEGNDNAAETETTEPEAEPEDAETPAS